MTRPTDRRRLPLKLLTAVMVPAALLVAGCGSGVTVEGRPDPTPTPGGPRATPPIPPPTTPTPSATPEPSYEEKPGGEFGFTTQQGKGHTQILSYSWKKTGVGETSISPANVYLVVKTRTTADEGKVAVNPLYYTVVGADGKIYPNKLGVDGNEPVLANITLKTGASVDGVVSFDLPQTDVTLQFADELGNKVGEIRIPAV